MVTRRSPRIYRLIGAIGTNRFVTRVHPVVYGATGGRLFTHVLGVTNIVMETTGAKSGQPRPVPVFAFEDGDGLIVIASNGGRGRPSAWAANLRATPAIVVRQGRRTRSMLARELAGDDRARAWSLAVTRYPGFDDYAAWTPGTIPVFRLEPA